MSNIINAHQLAPEKDILLTTINRIEDALEVLNAGEDRGEDLRSDGSGDTVPAAVADLL